MGTAIIACLFIADQPKYFSHEFFFAGLLLVFILYIVVSIEENGINNPKVYTSV